MHTVSTPEISVLMPAYNAAPFIRESVASVLNQTEKNFELIIINDGSTDETDDIVHEICSTDCRIVYLTQSNRGIVASLNRGLELCRGTFIARMDADDVAHPRRLEFQLRLLKEDPSLIICGSHARAFGGRSHRMRMPLSDGACRSMLLFAPSFIHPSVMFRRSIINAGIRYRIEYPHVEDYDFWIQVSKLGKMKNIRKPLLRYRVHDSQISSLRREEQRGAHIKIAMNQLENSKFPLSVDLLRDVLWPSESGKSKVRLLILYSRIFLYLFVQGKLSMLLMFKTISKIFLR